MAWGAARIPTADVLGCTRTQLAAKVQSPTKRPRVDGGVRAEVEALMSECGDEESEAATSKAAEGAYLL